MNREAGESLRNHLQELARKVVEAQYTAQPELAARYGEAGRLRCLEDTQYHLACFAEAVAYDAPSLFADYLAWAKALLASRHVPGEDLLRNLGILRQALRPDVPEEVLRTYFDPPVAALPSYPIALPCFLDPSSANAQLAQTYLDKLVNGDGASALGLVISHVQAGGGVQTIYKDVVVPVLREIGRLWQLRKIDEAQEHYCSHMTERLLTLLSSYFRPTAKRRRVFLGFSVAQEQHALGLRVVADAFEMAGWDVVHLGANVPAQTLSAVVRLWRPDVIGVSVTMPQHLPQLEKAIQALRSQVTDRPPKVLVGGRPFIIERSLSQKFDVDGCPEDGIAAVGLCE